MENFYLKDITLSNFRKFSQDTFRLNRSMNVLIGKNAAGKTTILEAVNVMLGAYLAAYKKYVPSRFVYNISDPDILQKTVLANRKEAALAPSIRQFPCFVSGHLVWGREELQYSRIVEKEGGRTKFAGKNPMQPMVLVWEEKIARADGSDAEEIFPLVLYLSSARLWNENRGTEFESIPTRTDAYQRCLDRKRSSQSAFRYIKALTGMALEENEGKPYPAYEIIMEAVRYSLREELQEGQKVVYSSRYGEIAVRNPDGTVIRFDALSDGYRNVIKIVTDIATKMCMLNPYLGQKTLECTPGIVVIDELDLSLHPTWQRRIVRILKTLFPKVQFVCATHSPFIIQSLEPGELIGLDDIMDEEYSGQSIEDIAEDIMKVPVPQYSEKKIKMYQAAEAYFEAVKNADSKEKIKVLKEKMDLLSAEYSDNPAYCALIKQKYFEKKAEEEK